MNPDQTNATAGPSSQPELFLLPWQLPPQPSTHIKATQDLITRLGLLSTYDKHVRPHAVPVAPPLSDLSGPALQTMPNSPMPSPSKGKGKEREPSIGLGTMDAPTPGGPGLDGADDEGKGERKRKNTYKHLIKGVPGKHSTKKDDYLVTSVSIPPKPRTAIQAFDSRTQRDAFSITLGGLPGWNTGALLAETPKDKEMKKQRKAQRRAVNGAPPTPVAGASPAASNGFAIPSTPSVGTPLGRPATPRVPGTPRVSGIVHNVQPRSATPRVSAPPTPATTVTHATPTPSAAPTPAPATIPHHHPLPARPQVNVEPPRGKKREWDDSGVVSNGHHPPATLMNGSAYTGGGALAGGNGPRPRPVKKQKVELFA